MFHWIQLWWDTWNLRAVILFSLFLQTFLFFSAPLRKRTANSLVTIPIWLAYNLADATAIFGVGLISKPCGNALGAYANPELVAFWAPFLLLHLGGPDTITAFALEDNELWLRHLLQLVVQLATSAYVFILTLTSNNQLWLPTLLMFFSALLKSTERTRSLYLGSWRRFRDSMIREPNPGPNYHKPMDEYFSNQESGLPSHPKNVEAPNPEPSVGENNEPMPDPDINVLDPDLLEAVYRHPEPSVGDNNEPMPSPDINRLAPNLMHFVYRHFETVKGLIADLKLSSRERDKSRLVFLELKPKQAFESVTIEFNFLYDILFTKTTVLHGLYRFNPIRFVSSVSCFAALLLFHSIDPKHKFLHHKIDVEITYTLLFGTIVHDVIAFFVIITSEWSAVTMDFDNLGDINCFLCFKICLLNLWALCYAFGLVVKFVLVKVIPIMERRWSGCISQYNLIFYCLNPRSKKWDKLIGNLGLTNILDGRKYVTTKRFKEVLRDFILQELKIKSMEAVAIETAKEFCSAKGDWVLGRQGACDKLLPYTHHADYDKILILWHIATELCYNTEEGNSKNEEFREISKVLSDYMLYLLIMEPSMMFAVAGTAQIRFRDTCAEAKLFFEDRGVLEQKEKYSCLYNINSPCLNACLNTCCCNKCTAQQNEFHRTSNLFNSGHKPDIIHACNSLLDVETEVNPSTFKGDTSKTVLFDACILAKELKKLDKDKWEILSKVWVELLSYGACRSNAKTHATHLSKGGQLISLVWLLMVHLGLGDRFEVSGGH